MRVAVTGGIGSGKSAVSARLARHGAVVVDADAIAREVVEPGTPGLAAVAAEFGPSVLTADGRLDRAAMAALVFADDERRRALEAIVHPLVGARSAELIAAAPPDAVVVYDVPLLAESAGGALGRVEGLDAVVVVEAPLAARVERLVTRGLSEADARARIAAQATDEERRRIADHVVVNDGDLADLDARVDVLWAALAPSAT
ncbi:MAG: dephospho-CoA kinase [Frankiales bacterium]|nr:dephospho-CoA kinase [Frankiales bacterium]